MNLSELIWQLIETARELNPGVFDTDILSGEIEIDPRSASRTSRPIRWPRIWTASPT